MAEDLATFYEHQADPIANEMAAFPPRDREAFLAHWGRILVDETVVTRTVLVDGRVAGNVGCFERFGLREVGYWIGREHWGRGVATRALSALLELVPTRPLYARVAVRNPASRRVLEKCGFGATDEADPAPEDPDDDVEEVLMRLDRP
jgi:RimJ/RimL family protein N-acetyltransferase